MSIPRAKFFNQLLSFFWEILRNKFKEGFSFLWRCMQREKKNPLGNKIFWVVVNFVTCYAAVNHLLSLHAVCYWLSLASHFRVRDWLVLLHSWCYFNVALAISIFNQNRPQKKKKFKVFKVFYAKFSLFFLFCDAVWC